MVTVQHKANYSLTSRHPTSAPCPLRQWSLTLGSETTCWAPDSFALLAATRQSKASLVVHHFLSTVTPGYWKLGFSTLDLMLTKRHKKEKITGTGKGVFTLSFSPVFCKSFPFALFPRMESPPPLWATNWPSNERLIPFLHTDMQSTTTKHTCRSPKTCSPSSLLQSSTLIKCHLAPGLCSLAIPRGNSCLGATVVQEIS